MNLCGGALKPFIPHPTKPDETLFLLFDFTHNFKNIFNNFLNKNSFNLPTENFEEHFGESCAPQFNHVKKIYAIEENKTLKVAHKLKKASLNPSSIARTSPQHALGKMIKPVSLSILTFYFFVLVTMMVLLKVFAHTVWN